MIYTSYFAKLKSLPNNVLPIAICGKVPNWYKGLEYKKLAPKYKFFMQWKETHDNRYYIEHFQSEVLDNLNAHEVVLDLFNKLDDKSKNIIFSTKIPLDLNPKINIALICYEKPLDFCHRHLVSEWLNKNELKW